MRRDSTINARLEVSELSKRVLKYIQSVIVSNRETKSYKKIECWNQNLDNSVCDVMCCVLCGVCVMCVV